MTEQNWMSNLRTLPIDTARKQYNREMNRRNHFFKHHRTASLVALMGMIIIITTLILIEAARHGW